MELETLLKFIEEKTGLKIDKEEAEEIMSPKDEPNFYEE